MSARIYLVAFVLALLSACGGGESSEWDGSTESPVGFHSLVSSCQRQNNGPSELRINVTFRIDLAKSGNGFGGAVAAATLRVDGADQWAASSGVVVAVAPDHETWEVQTTATIKSGQLLEATLSAASTGSSFVGMWRNAAVTCAT